MKTVKSTLLVQFSILIALMLSQSGCALFNTQAENDWEYQKGLADEARTKYQELRTKQLQLIQRGLASAELVPGMSANDVRSVWGEPYDIQTAGDPSLGNQMWIYTSGPSLSGRVVYFEAGRVVGWKSSSR